MTDDITLDILDELGIRNTYRVFKDNILPKAPFAVWYITGESFTGSDSKAMIKSSDYTIELYTIGKDFELEQRLESLIPESDFRKNEEYISGDKAYCHTYTYTTTKKIRRT